MSTVCVCVKWGLCDVQFYQFLPFSFSISFCIAIHMYVPFDLRYIVVGFSQRMIRNVCSLMDGGVCVCVNVGSHSSKQIREKRVKLMCYGVVCV